RDPVVGRFCYVAKEGGKRIKVVEDYVDVAVVEKIPEGGASGADDGCQTTAGGGGNLGKLFAVEIAVEKRALRVGRAPVGVICNRVDMSVGDEEIEQAVVVEVQEAGPPTEKRNSGNA